MVKGKRRAGATFAALGMLGPLFAIFGLSLHEALEHEGPGHADVIATLLHGHHHSRGPHDHEHAGNLSPVGTKPQTSKGPLAPITVLIGLSSSVNLAGATLSGYCRIANGSRGSPPAPRLAPPLRV